MTATEIRGNDAFRTLTALCLCTLSLGKKKQKNNTTATQHLKKKISLSLHDGQKIKLKETLLFPLVFEI